MRNEDKIKLFRNELNWIRNPKKREFAEAMIAGAHDYFFVVPASSSGKYHPQFDLGDGGLVRHTRCVTYFAKCLAISHMFSEEMTDNAIIAALAHDIVKQGNGSGGYTVTEHPLLAAKYVEDLRKQFVGVFNDDEFEDIVSGIKSHMGQWGEKDGLPVPKTVFQFVIHDADYVASRKEILDFKFEPTESVEIVEETAEKQPVYNGNPKDYVLQFGKHKGKTLEEAEPTGYLDWMVKQEDFFNKEAQEMARLYLESLNTNASKPAPAPAVINSEIDNLPF